MATRRRAGLGDPTGSTHRTKWSAAADLVDPPELRWRRDPVGWAGGRGLELWSKQREILESVRDHANTVVQSCHSASKGLWIDTPLPTPSGWTRIGDVQVGDLVYNESGRPVRVTTTSPVRYIDCYRVTFDSGASLICDGEHLWSVLDISTRRRIRGRVFVRDWREHWDDVAACDVTQLRDVVRRDARRGRPSVPMSRALETSEVDVLIPPYVLGVWLGDGCSWNATIANHPDDAEIAEHIEKLGWKTFRSERRPIDVRLRPTETESFQPLLRAYGLIRNKHIPTEYLRASYEQRLELLRGLMDTDGCVATRVSPTVAITQKSELLARQIHELVRSLGWKAALRRHRATLYGKDCGPVWCVTFSADVPPFHLSRKVTLWRKPGARPTIHTVMSVERVPTVPTRCITVDSPRGLYLAGRDIVVTHNSYTAALTACWWLDVHPVGEARVITTAPTSKQVDAVLWYEINRFHEKLGLRGECHMRDWYVGRQLVALGRKPPDHQEAAFQGMHARFLLVIYDEAFGIPKTLWDEGSSLASNVYGRQLAIGNPDGPGEFRDNCLPGSGWNVIKISYRDTPNFTGEPVSPRLRELLISERWVAERRRRWGESSALFQAKCEGRFPTGGDPFAVVNHDWAVACRTRELAPDDAVVEAGIDVGGGGDRTVIRERRGPVAGREDEFVDADPMRTVGRLAERLAEWGVGVAKVDSTGLGWALAGRLRELSSHHNPTGARLGQTTHAARVVPVNFGAGPPPAFARKFLNMRAYLWWQVARESTRQGLWDLTALDDDVVHELTAPRYEIMDSYGKIKIEPKDDVIKRLGVSPDRAEALILAFHTAHRPAAALGWSSLAGADLVGGAGPGDRLTRGNS